LSFHNDGKIKILLAFSSLASPVVTGIIYADETAEK